ncbi:MAG: RNA methyltransferase [Candidatus Omnitrophica bacterium]|nr:RNA methyltransferase [Candidatus Omnitrophota bacterium]
MHRFFCPESVRKDKPDLPVIVLACAIPEKSKFELIIEKAAELGVDEIIPLKTKRTAMGSKGDRSRRTIARYQSVAVNAAKRSRRSRVPIIHPIADLASVLKFFPEETTLFIPSLPEGEGEGGERRNIFEAFKDVPSPSRIVFLIGPEGDFTPHEYGLARARGCIGVSLGKTVLKVETAALVAVACAQLWFRR